jgi:NAD(P)-dependent dehydrogenase (short-subunit alcohol dehydrogenase family)
MAKKEAESRFMQVANKVVLITGAGAGIGLAAARLLAGEGAYVVLVDLHAAALAEAVAAIGPRASHVVADVSDPPSMRQVVDTTVERHGGIDVFIANAGIEGSMVGIVDYPLEQFDRVMAVNVRGVWLGIQNVVPVMRQRGGGSIVITSSGAGTHGMPKMAAYSASKHAVIGLMRSAAIELAKDNIRVNTVNPGPIETRMMRSIEENLAPGAAEKIRQRFEHATPLKRYGTPDEIAQMMLFLASDASSYCTGAVYAVDGGDSA